MTNKIDVINLNTPKPSAKGYVFIIGGAAIMLVGLIMCLSIVLLLPGLGAFLIGFLLMYGGLPRTEVECRACGQAVGVRSGFKQAKCGGCNTVTPVKWNK